MGYNVHELSDKELYRKMQRAKKSGTPQQQDTLRREMSHRFEERLEQEEGLDPVEDIAEVA